jgi:membrane-bound inhibitor of C-type lysozyme
MMLLAGGFSIGCRSGDTPSAASPGGVARVTQEVEGSRVGAAPLAAYAFTCHDGREFVLAWISGEPEAVDLIVGGRRQCLAHVPTGSGARYAAGGTSVWTKGREARLELDGKTHRGCGEALR